MERHYLLSKRRYEGKLNRSPGLLLAGTQQIKTSGEKVFILYGHYPKKLLIGNTFEELLRGSPKGL
jgi:hypothetical protein